MNNPLTDLQTQTTFPITGGVIHLSCVKIPESIKGLFIYTTNEHEVKNYLANCDEFHHCKISRKDAKNIAKALDCLCAFASFFAPLRETLRCALAAAHHVHGGGMGTGRRCPSGPRSQHH